MTNEQAIGLMANERGVSIEEMTNDMQHDFLTVNTGRDGVQYAWYLDEHDNIAIDATGRKLSAEEIEKILE